MFNIIKKKIPKSRIGLLDYGDGHKVREITKWKKENKRESKNINFFYHSNKAKIL